MDVKIKSDEVDFKMRVAGCLVENDKLLVLQMCHNGFYCLPGGHVHLGESSRSAMAREFQEEVGINCKVGDMIALNEYFFTNRYGKKVHEVCYYYLIEPLERVETVDFDCVEDDEGVLKDLEFRWVNISDLKNTDFRPMPINEKLQKLDYRFEHIIFER